MSVSLGVVTFAMVVRLHLHLDWPYFFNAFWVILTFQSIFAAGLFYLLTFPLRETVGPWIKRVQSRGLSHALFPLLIAVATGLIKGTMTDLWSGIIFGVDALIFVEFLARIGESHDSIARRLRDIAAPTCYVFFGFVIVLVWNDLIAASRFDGLADLRLNRADALLMGGHTIHQLAGQVLSRSPGWLPAVSLFVYFIMPPQVGACILLVTIIRGKLEGLLLAGSLVIGYFLASLIFFMVPATGPYYLAPASVHSDPSILAVQQSTNARLNSFREHTPLDSVKADYFIALPSLHILQPLTTLWFVRRWRTLQALIATYLALLVLSTLLLEQHYLVDIIAAFPVAAIAICMVTAGTRKTAQGRSGS